MNKLVHLREFKEILSGYQTSEETKKIVNNTHLVLLSAISSSGRNTMIRELVKTKRYYFIVSDTTRKLRVNDGILEKNGNEYWFKSEQDVLDGLRKGQYVEAAIIHNQQVSGISISEITRANQLGLIAVKDIEIQGTERIVSFSKNTIPVFVIPPDYLEWRNRLRNRGDMHDQELVNRLMSAKEELKYALSKDYYHFLINDSLKDSIKGLDKLAHGIVDPIHEKQGRETAREILVELEKALAK